MKKKIVALALLLSMAVSLAGCGTKKSTADPSTGTQDTITLTMAMTDSEQTNYYKGAMKIVDAVKEATNGRIVIDVKPGGTLGNETDELDMVIQGDLDIAACSSSVISNYIPELSICSPLTGVTSNSWDTPAGHRVYDACRGFSVSWVCRGSGASGVSSASC
mgnify:CR=1 FL=1